MFLTGYCILDISTIKLNDEIIRKEFPIVYVDGFSYDNSTIEISLLKKLYDTDKKLIIPEVDNTHDNKIPIKKAIGRGSVLNFLSSVIFPSDNHVDSDEVSEKTHENNNTETVLVIPSKELIQTTEIITDTTAQMETDVDTAENKPSIITINEIVTDNTINNNDNNNDNNKNDYDINNDNIDGSGSNKEIIPTTIAPLYPEISNKENNEVTKKRPSESKIISLPSIRKGNSIYLMKSIQSIPENSDNQVI